MSYRWLLNSKPLVFVPLVLALVIAVACGSDATDTPAPTATLKPGETPPTKAPTATKAPTSTPEPVDLGLLVSPDPNPKKGGTMQSGGSVGVGLFDMHQCSSSACIQPMGQFYDNLVRFDPYDVGMSSVIPDLAKSWTVSDDQLVYTFFLRDARWQDGTDFSADDIVATYQRIVFPPTHVISIRKALFQAVDKIEKVDSKTVKFTLREPRGLFLSSLALSFNVIYQAKQLKDNNDDLKTVKLPVGTGPFKFINYKVGENWTSERNDDYWNPDLPYLDGLVIQELKGSAIGGAFIAGHLDFARGVGGADAKAEIEKMPDAVFGLHKHPAFFGAWFNTKRPPWDDARMRRAVHWGIDKVVLRKAGEDTGFYTPEGWLTSADPRAEAYWETGKPLGDGTPTKDRIGWRSPTDEDKDKARALMAEVLGPGVGLKNVDYVDRALAEWFAISPVFGGLLKQELNIEVDISTHPKTLVFEKFRTGDCTLCVEATSMTLALLEDYWGLTFWSQGPQNWGKWSNQEFDDNYIEILRAPGGPKKNALINRGMEILDEEVPMFIMMGTDSSQAWRTWLKGHRRGLTRSAYGPFRWEAAFLDK